MIEVGEDYSKDRKNDYTAETEDGYIACSTYIHTYTHYRFVA